MGRKLRFGIANDFRNLDPEKRSFVELYESGIERAVLAEELGYDYFYASEHHFTAEGHSPSLAVILGAVAARTSRIRLSTYVFLLPLHDPLRVAEDFATLDIISNGRAELGVGLGYRAEEFEIFGIDRRARGSIADESCDVLIKAWSEENWSYEGRHFQYRDLTVTPRPVQRPYPKLWISARAPKAARRAARLRAPLMIAPAPYVEDHREVYDAYADALREQGDDPAEFEVMGSFATHVLAPGQKARVHEASDARLQKYIDWYAEAGDMPNDGARIANPSEKLRSQIGVTGDAATCIAELERHAGEVPYTHLLVGGYTDTQVRRFADEVMPHFR